MQITSRQRDVLTKEHVDGVCIRGAWTWLIDGEPVTRQVNTLLKRGLLAGMYFHGGRATASITDAGRDALRAA